MNGKNAYKNKYTDDISAFAKRSAGSAAEAKSLPMDGVFSKLDVDIEVIEPEDGILKKPLERGRNLDKIKGKDVDENYSVIDNFDYDRGIATGVKSRNLKAKSSQRERILERVIKKDVDKLNPYNGKDWGNIHIFFRDIKKKVLEVIVPNIKLSELQIEGINRAAEYAAQKGINIRIIVGGH